MSYLIALRGQETRKYFVVGGWGGGGKVWKDQLNLGSQEQSSNQLAFVNKEERVD